MEQLTNGELFAGISGFGLGLEKAGIKTVWRVEIDKNCQQLLKAKYPDDLLLSDVRDCGRHNLPRVDIISFGSPCQDLSVAGKRDGLKGERSGLFHEAIRIIHELQPTFAIWENVPGVFSSNSGRDFATVLSAFRECGARDIAWRVLDARYFGVAQRRRRVFVIADFGGERSAEILFESESMSRDSAKGRKKGKGSPRVIGTLPASGGGLDRPSASGNQLDFYIPASIPRDIGRTERDRRLETGWDTQRTRITDANGVAPTLSQSDGKGGQRTPNVAIVTSGEKMFDEKGIHHEKLSTDVTPTLNAFDTPLTFRVSGIGEYKEGVGTLRENGGDNGGGSETIIAFQQNTRDEVRQIDGDGKIVGALSANAGMKQQNYVARSQTSRNQRNDSETENLIAYSIAGNAIGRKPENGPQRGDVSENISHIERVTDVPAVSFVGKSSASSRSLGETEELSATLDSDASANVAFALGVRRLMPIECERLQGFSDNWTEGFSDTIRYKMLGNAVCVYVIEWIGKRLVVVVKRFSLQGKM